MNLICALLLAKQLASAVLPIDNFQQVAPGLFRGGRPTIGQIADLSMQGFRTNINLQGGDLNNSQVAGLVKWFEPGESAKNIALEKSTSEELGMKFYNFPLNSLSAIDEAADKMIDEALALMGDPAHRPLFIHCQHGKDRTGLLVALYRVKFEGWTPDAAHAEWVAMGHGSFSALFTGQLDNYFYEKAATFRPGPRQPASQLNTGVEAS